jgi:exosortase C (VPDSG-CTERM-specific)
MFSFSKPMKRSPHSRQLMAFALVALGLLALFAKPLLALVAYTSQSQLNSHILLVPFVSAYLLYIRRHKLPATLTSSPGWGFIPLAVGGLALFLAWNPRFLGAPLSENDYLALTTLAFVCFLVGAGFLLLGSKWMAAATFPVAFLIFMVPMPDVMADSLETASKLASADAAHLFFLLAGTPILRDGTIFQLPGIAIQVAQECSGIRSSWVLIITSLLAANLFLETAWRRVVLVCFVIPLGILRNGFRIMVIGVLCVRIGPEMIHSIIHRRGGPVFFSLSLIPLFLLLWWLRRGEIKSGRSDSPALPLSRAQPVTLNTPGDPLPDPK